MQSSAKFRVLLSADDICSAMRRYSFAAEAEEAMSPRLRMSCESISSEAARVLELVESTPYSTQNCKTLLLGTVLSIIAKIVDSFSLNLLSPSCKGKMRIALQSSCHSCSPFVREPARIH